jgi:hypothetical protein
MANPQRSDRRRQLIGLAHLGATQLGLDEDTRRAAQAAWTGHASCADMTEAELVAWCWELKRRGATIGIPTPPACGGLSLGRPTPAQLARIEALAAALGLQEAALAGFCQRTVGIDDPRWLTRAQASDVISGLSRWAASRGADARSKTRTALDALLQDEPGHGPEHNPQRTQEAS